MKKITLKFAEPKSQDYAPETARDDLTKEEVIQLAMDAFDWKELKCIAWYKLEIKGLAGNSPKELVQRGQTSKIVELLKREKSLRLNFEKNQAASQRD